MSLCLFTSFPSFFFLGGKKEKKVQTYNEHVACQVCLSRLFFAVQCQVFVQKIPPLVIGTIYNFKARQTPNNIGYKSLTPGKTKVVILYRHRWQVFVSIILRLWRIQQKWWICLKQKYTWKRHIIKKEMHTGVKIMTLYMLLCNNFRGIFRLPLTFFEPVLTAFSFFKSTIDKNRNLCHIWRLSIIILNSPHSVMNSTFAENL